MSKRQDNSQVTVVRFETPYNKRNAPPHHTPPPTSEGGEQASARAWNNWWSRRSPNLPSNGNKPTRLGIDAGSKTLKLVALDDDGQIVFALYHRHRSDVLTTLAELIHDAIWRYGDMTLPVAVTGSAGIALGEMLGIPFVQEVVATTNAVKSRYPDADCVIELGGEDAKITYLSGNVEQRMNATCAGGTGDFIDGIANMLGVRTRDISKLALGAQRIYPIASRCAVFAQTDVRPLINSGARKADIAQSALDAVVRQTLGGLACGRPITGKVVFLGGPLEYVPALVITFRKKLGLDRESGIKPPDAHLFTAMGAIITANDSPATPLSELERRARSVHNADDGIGHLPPLFKSTTEAERFAKRHARDRIVRKRLDETVGPLFLGFDAGSTTIKYALIDQTGALVASDYRNVEGDTLAVACRMLDELLLRLEGNRLSPTEHRIAHAAVIGYGEELLRAGLGFDLGMVETVAHLRAAQQLRPDASFVLDIGGQDMKALWVQDGQVVDTVLNEACSSGCGAFVQSSAHSLKLTYSEFSRLALESKHPVDLGAKCTVFMTSRVRHAQKTGAPKGDIAAGIAYSVVNNVMTRIIGKNHSASLGDAIVVQGGTFKSDAVLRAFEKITGVDVVRPDLAHLMGAYGAALIARDKGSLDSSLVHRATLSAMSPKRLSSRCPGCNNACQLTIVDFGNGKRHISGNRCNRAHEEVFGEYIPTARKTPNVVALEQKLIASYGDIKASGSRGEVSVGLMNVLNMFESMPFWHTLFTKLGFSVIVPDNERTAYLVDRAAGTIPSESVCHPAKIMHARYVYLVDAGADFVFMPVFERGTRCPVASSYVNALRDNVEPDRLLSPVLRPLKPQAIAVRTEDRASLLETICKMLPDGNRLEEDEFERAFACALEAQIDFERTVSRATEKALTWTAANKGRRIIVLASRPYHIDPALVHHIDEELARLGFAVVPLLGLRDRITSISDRKGLWKPSRHLLRLVELAASNPQMEIVALRSFGCCYDAVSIDEARDLAVKLRRPFTELKIDDISNMAHIRIRLRTLAYTCGLGTTWTEAYGRFPSPTEDGGNVPPPQTPTPDLCSTAKAIVEKALRKIDANPDIESLEIPFACQDCMTDALDFELSHLRSKRLEVRTVSNPPTLDSENGDRPRVGLLGNPLLVYNPEINDNVVNLIEQLGWQPIFPDPKLIEIEDVRYLDQLERFREQDVERVVYLQSFGCLKGHVQVRGALHALSVQFPDMPITVIDYDPEASALSRENRIRLALS